MTSSTEKRIYRPEEFASPSLPRHITIYTWPSCTLNELALELADSKPSPVPSPASGTRLAFQLVCPDLRATGTSSNAHPKYAVKDMGSIVISDNGSSLGDPDLDNPSSKSNVGFKTLSDAKFVVGDYISCAVLPPLADGSIAPESNARRDSVLGTRDVRGSYRGGFIGQEPFNRGSSRGGSRGGRGGRREGGGGDGGAGFPMGEWRRGEQLPDAPSGRPGGRNRW